MEGGNHTEEDMVRVGAMTSAMHIIDGLVHHPNKQKTILEIWDQGCMELYHSLIPYAIECDRLYSEGYAKYEDGIAGVFDYEVSCDFGAWFGHTIITTGKAPTNEEAMEKLTEFNREFWARAE